MRRLDLDNVAVRSFAAERHLATLSTVRADGSPHVVPVGFTLDGEVVRIITSAGSTKVANARRGGRASVCQVDRGRWLTFEGVVSVVDDPAEVAHAVGLYAVRYRPPSERVDRVVVRIDVDRVMGTVSQLASG